MSENEQCDGSLVFAGKFDCSELRPFATLRRGDQQSYSSKFDCRNIYDRPSIVECFYTDRLHYTAQHTAAGWKELE